MSNGSLKEALLWEGWVGANGSMGLPFELPA
jgi:hypothetical protein